MPGIYQLRNILIREDKKSGKKSILVIDVGEAQMTKRFRSFGRRGYTPEYVSPERERNKGGEASFASDVWFESIYIFVPPVTCSSRANGL